MKHTDNHKNGKNGQQADSQTHNGAAGESQNASVPGTENNTVKPEAATADANKAQADSKHPTDAEKIASLEKALVEMEDKRLRMLAEMDNQRKRIAKDMENLRHSVTCDTLHPFFQVFDHFSMAVSAASNTNNLKSLLDGMKMIQTEFDKAFSELGVEKIDAVGKDFDPKYHEAVSQEPSAEIPAGKIIRQWALGFKSGEKLLKPASVVVSSGPQKTE